jgi:regulator of RNase E activity RraB
MLEGNMSLDLNKIIEEAEKLGYNFTLKDAQDVIDTKPEWCHKVETEASAVADYIDAYGG